MVDYYSELKIDKSLGIVDINKALSKLESTWRRRELTNPERATKMLSLILEARRVFQTEAARRKYDQQLDGKTEQHSKEVQDRLQMEKLKSDAISFFNSEQYDLALITINRAMSLMTRLNIEDSSILSLAADIYRHNGDHRTALDYINRAILAEPDDPMNYLIKAAIVGDVGQKRNNLKIAIDIASRNNFLTIKKEILGVYAHSLYFENPTDRAQAEQYAREALRLGETWGNAQEVIGAIENEQLRRKQQQEEAERKDRERAAQEETQSKADEQRRRELEEAQIQAEEQERKDKKKASITTIAVLVFILLFGICLLPSAMGELMIGLASTIIGWYLIYFLFILVRAIIKK